MPPPSACQQARVAAGRGGVDADHALGREARDVVRAARLGAGAGHALTAERLAFDHRADLVAVDVEVADPRAGLDEAAGRLDPAVEAEREAVAGGVDVLDHPAELARLETHDVE